MTSYRTFGYVREGRRSDLYRRLFGYPNLMKRLQARDVMDALALEPSDRALDLGCAYGMFTIEMARVAAEAVGIDVAPPGATDAVPPELEGRLRFLTGDGRRLPFEDGHFDAVLASEVLMMIPEPAEFLAEVRRVLRPGGRLVVVNGVGHPAIERAYARRSTALRVARSLWPSRFPESYDAYCERLREFFGTAFAFRPPDWYRALVADNGFEVVAETRSPTDGGAAAVSWDIFLYYLRTGRANPFWLFETKYALFGLLGRLLRGRTSGGQVLVARRAAALGGAAQPVAG